MFNAICKAIKQGVKIMIASRVPNGRVLPVYGYEGGGKSLHKAGAHFADHLSPQKARILLMLMLQENSEDNGVEIRLCK